MLALFVLLLIIGVGQTVTPAPPAVFFDDFSYEDTEALEENGWIVRTEEGWPGVPGALWSDENVTIIEDPEDEENRLVQMISSSNGETTVQTQFCQARKFLEGTYAARLRFSDEPQEGPDGDQIVQTFYLISPLEFDLDPNYSETDFEYLPNGGWGFRENVLFGTTWETFRPEPQWLAENTSGNTEDSFEGWHTLVLQIMDGEVSYYVDGELIDTHSDKYYPEVPMSLNFNQWFINGGLIDSDEERHYVEQIDWVYHEVDALLTPEEIEERVAQLREDEVTHIDTVPETDFVSPCNF